MNFCWTYKKEKGIGYREMLQKLARTKKKKNFYLICSEEKIFGDFVCDE